MVPNETRQFTVMMSALLIRAPYIDWILGGSKICEIRGSRTTKRGRIGLIQSGTRKVVGVADLVDVVGPLRADFISNARKLGLRKSEVTDRSTYAQPYAWVLKGARRLRTPVRYKHPFGSIIWVTLGTGVQSAVVRQLGKAKISLLVAPPRTLGANPVLCEERD
jgi:hypothetical protein